MALGVAVVLLLWLAPAASAGPPPNDDFVDAEDLGAGFPVETHTWSNVDATAEPGEPFLLYTAGHSVWFEGHTPATQGSFELKVAKTPPLPNDDFDQAMSLWTSVTAELAEGFSQAAWMDGFNWNATKEAGEPKHGGDPGGASAWYAWTAPVSARAELGACSSSLDFFLGLYTGNSVDALTPVAVESRPAPCSINFFAIARTTYRIAIDGRLDAGTGMPKMGSHHVVDTAGNRDRSPAVARFTVPAKVRGQR